MLELLVNSLTSVWATFPLLGIALFTYDRTGAWSHPAVVFASFWFVVSFIPLVVLIGTSVTPFGTLYIAAAAAAFAAPSFFMKWSVAVETASHRKSQPQTEAGTTLLVLFLLLQAVTMLGIVINLTIQGVSFAALFSNPMGTARIYLDNRYAGSIVSNPFSQLGIVTNYIAAGLGGLLVSRVSLRRNVLIYVAAFTPALAHVLIYADKGTIFLCAAYFFGGIIVRRVQWGETALINIRTVRVSGLALAVLVPLMALAMLTRGVDAWSAEEVPAMVAFYLRSYAFGHIFAYSDWFDHFVRGVASTMTYSDPEGMTWGFWTFMALGRYLMPEYILPDGYFAEYYLVPGVMQSNIYTMFRGLIYDFGLVGGLAFMAAAGWLSAFAYRAMMQLKATALSGAFYIFLAGYIYTSYIISLAIWPSAIAAAVGLFAVLLGDQYFTESRSRASSEAQVHA